MMCRDCEAARKAVQTDSPPEFVTSDTQDVRSLLANWEIAATPDALGLHNGGGFAQEHWASIRQALIERVAIDPNEVSEK